MGTTDENVCPDCGDSGTVYQDGFGGKGPVYKCENDDCSFNFERDVS